MGFLFELRRAIFHDVGDNETALDGQPGFDDPVKHRMGATISRVYGILSGDRLGISRKECTMLQFRENDRHPGQDGGQFRFFAQRPGTEDDANMIPLLDLDTDKAVFHVPVEGLGGGGGAYPDSMWSPDGLFVTQQQSDGNFVSYELARPFDRGRFRALWSSWGGKVADPQWQGT